ncbi:MAG: hypothetical protein V5A48_10950 [Salinivenus sp.]
MSTSAHAEVRPTNGTLLAIVPAALFGGGLGLLFSSLFVSADVFEELLAPTPLVVMTVGALLLAAALIANRRGSAPTEVRVEDDRLLVEAPEAWWVTVTDQLPLTVRTVERTAGALVVTGLLDRWWDWGRYTVRIESDEAAALDAHLVELRQE